MKSHLKNWLNLSILYLIIFVVPPIVMAEGEVYGHKFSYDRVKHFQFPDFKLQFIGTKPGPFYPGSTAHRLGDCYEFRISRGKSEQKICWSEGTGDIGPVVFEVQGKCFWLERVESTQFGRMGDTEAVVTVDTEAPSACKRRNSARQQSNPLYSKPSDSAILK